MYHECNVRFKRKVSVRFVPNNSEIPADAAANIVTGRTGFPTCSGHGETAPLAPGGQVTTDAMRLTFVPKSSELGLDDGLMRHIIRPVTSQTTYLSFSQRLERKTQGRL